MRWPWQKQPEPAVVGPGWNESRAILQARVLAANTKAAAARKEYDEAGDRYFAASRASEEAARRLRAYDLAREAIEEASGESPP